jgi:hypothetical protein
MERDKTLIFSYTALFLSLIGASFAVSGVGVAACQFISF